MVVRILPGLFLPLSFLELIWPCLFVVLVYISGMTGWIWWVWWVCVIVFEWGDWKYT